MDDSTEVQDFITFTHAGNKFALEITRILEIQVLKEITFIPNVPAFFAGAVNIRGDILLVINILRFLKLQERGLADMTKIIIVQAGEIKRGILANEVSKMALIKKTDLRPSDGSISEDNQKFILGMTSGLHLILNIETILAEQNMKLLQDSLSHLDGD
ncbi:chemotaxis protein CheW [bacterium]|nr:chemotaxis protein CheW [bacterium]